MTGTAKQALTYLGNLGSALPTAIAQHRGNFYWKRASGAEDELYAGVRDAAGANQLRRLLTKTYADTLYALLTGANFTGSVSVAGSYRDNSGTGWTATATANMGSSPGALAQSGHEYCGRIVQTTGASLTDPGALWDVVFEHARATANFTVLLSPGNSDSAALQLYVSSTATTGFTIASVGDPPNGNSLRCSWFIVDRV